MGAVKTWVRREPLSAATLACAILISGTYAWQMDRLQSEVAHDRVAAEHDRATSKCQADYDTRYNAALLARADAVDEVIYRIAIQARDAGPDQTRKVLARYLTARSDAASSHPLPSAPAC